MAKAGYIVGVLAIFAILITVGPLLILWSINTLFGLGIAYNVKTWAATLILASAFKDQSLSRKELKS